MTLLRRRTLLGGSAVAVPHLAHAACDTSRWRKILDSMVPEAHACGGNTTGALFSDDFATLSLYNTRNTAAGGTWQPAGTFSTFVDGQDFSGVWVVNPFNPTTPYNNVYTVSGSILSMRIDNSPNSANTGGDTLIGGQLHTFNTFQHAVQGYWEVRAAVPVLPGSNFVFWLNDQTGRQQIGIFDCVTTQDSSHFAGFDVWDPATNTETFQWFTYQMTNPVDVSTFHQYGVKVTNTQVTNYIDRIAQQTTNLPAGYTNPMFIFLDWFSGGVAGGTGLISSPVSQPYFAQVDYVAYYTPGTGPVP